MTIARSFENGGQFKLTDITPSLLLVPNTYGEINNSGIFRDEFISQDNFTFEVREGTLSFIPDVLRGSRHTVNSDDTRLLKTIPVPHFVLDDAIYPSDIQGKRAYGADRADTLAEVRARKLERIMRNWDITRERAKCQAIVDGTIYAPNGTVVVDWYAEFGITRKNVDFDLGTATTDVLAKIEEVIAHIQDNVKTGSVVTEIVSWVSPEFFTKLINHATVKEAYKYYTSSQEPLRNRLGAGINRTFVYGGMTFREYRTAYGAGLNYRAIPVDEGRAIPVGVDDMFQFIHAPAGKFTHVNTIAERAYAWEWRDAMDEQITLQSESNFAAMVERPAAVVRILTST